MVISARGHWAADCREPHQNPDAIRQATILDQDPKIRRHPNRAEKRSLAAADVAVFVKQYGRKAQKGVEPNDRRFNRTTERRLARMDPAELDRLMRDDEE